MTANVNKINWCNVFSPATKHASKALRQWTSGQIGLTLDEVEECPFDELGNVLHDQNQLMTIVAMGIVGNVGGQLILMFDDHNARGLIELLLNRSAKSQSAWGELENSALRETGNIIASAYLNQMTELTGQRLFPSPPSVIRDYGGSVLQQAVLPQIMNGDEILLCRTRVEKIGDPVTWNMFFVPSCELLDELRKAASAGSSDELPEALPADVMYAILKVMSDAEIDSSISINRGEVF